MKLINAERLFASFLLSMLGFTSLFSQDFDFFQKEICPQSLQLAWDIYEITEDPLFIEDALLLMEQSKVLKWLATLDPITRSQLKTPTKNEGSPLLRLFHVDQDNQGLEKTLSENLAKLKQEYLAFEAILSEKCPVCKSFLEGIPSLATLQGEMAEANTTGVEYFASAKMAQVLVINPSTIHWENLGHSTTSQQDLFNFENALKNPLISIEEFVEASEKIYLTYWEPIKDWIGEKVTIVADGSLRNIAFETLISDLNKTVSSFKEASFLIKEKQFAYQSAFSLEWWSKVWDQPRYAPKILLGVNDRKIRSSERIADLDFINEELTQIKQEIFFGDILKGEKAKFSSFEKKAADYRLLHITSAVTSDKEGQETISFADQAQGPSSFVLKQLPADLVVLSNRMSSTKGSFWDAHFKASGCPNLISSLWPNHSEEKTLFMEAFYKEITEDVPFIEASQIAKLKIISEYKAAPYYWASFLPFGKNQSLNLELQVRYPYWIVVYLISLLTVFTVWKWRNRAKPLDQTYSHQSIK